MAIVTTLFGRLPLTRALHVGVAALALGLLLPQGARALSLRIEPTVSKSIVQESPSSTSVGSWNDDIFLANEIASSIAGAREFVIQNFTLKSTSGLDTWVFKFNAAVNGSGITNAGTTSYNLHIFKKGPHYWTQTVPVAAFHVVSMLTGEVDKAAVYNLFFTTDETGTFTPTAVLPTQCTTANDFITDGDGKPLGGTQNLNGHLIDPNQIILAAAACPIAGQSWPGSSTTIATTGIIFNLAAVPEPSAAMLLSLGLSGLAWMGRRRAR